MAEKRSALVSRSPPVAALLSARALSLVGDGVCNLTLIVYVQSTNGTGIAIGLLLLVFAPRTPEPDHRSLLRSGRSATPACRL